MRRNVPEEEEKCLAYHDTHTHSLFLTFVPNRSFILELNDAFVPLISLEKGCQWRLWEHSMRSSWGQE